MTTLTFYNGLREIGGTFVVVETDEARCMFDFGFAVMDRMDDKIAVRYNECAADYARLGALASQDGIYDEETAKTLGLVSFENDKKKNFFVISHMHIDHMGGLGMLDQNLPVYMSEDSLKLYRRLEACGDIQVKGHKNCIGIPYGESFTVGDITEAFGQKMKGVDVLITEGVTVSFDDVDILSLTKPEEPERSEEWLQDTICKESTEQKGLIIVNPYNRNVERLHHLIMTAQKTGRKLVMDGVQADYVQTFYPEDEILMYENSVGADAKKAEERGWSIITREELLSNPSKYILQQDYVNFYELMDLSSVITLYIHMDGAPLGDYDPSFGKMHRILDHMNIPYMNIGIGGHSRPYYLRTMLDTIAPHILVPLHSFRPEQVNTAHADKRILPEYGECFVFENGEMILKKN